MPPTCTISLNGGPDLAVKEAVFQHKEMEHEQALVTLPDVSRAASRWLSTGSPVLIRWGATERPLREFVGYVSHTKPIFQAAPTRDGEDLGVHCVGATFPLKDGDYWSRRNISATTPIREIAEQFRLDTTFIGRHQTDWPTLAQAGRSYWAFMVECAKRMGWTLYAHGTTVYCHERTTALALTRGAPYFMSSERAAGGRLHRFKNSVGATSPEGGQARQRHAYGVNDRTGSVVRHTNQANTTKPLLGAMAVRPVFGQGQAGMPVGSLAEAHDRLQGEELDNRLSIEAILTGDGNQTVMVGRALEVDGLSALDNGFWYVKGYVQRLRPQEFTIEATLGRDSEAGYRLPASPSPQVARGSRLINNRWVVA